MRRMTRGALALAAAAGLALPRPAAAGEPDGTAEPDGVLTVIVENDLFAGFDDQYTNGTYLRYTPGPNRLPLLGRAVRDAATGLVEADQWYVTYGFGQSMFTPDDITLRDPPLDDRPYAGFLFGTFAVSANTGSRLDTVALDIGFVGTPSLAEQTQEFIHTFIGDDPKGWGTQLGAELAFRLLYERTLRYGTQLPDAWGGLEVDVLPSGALAAGTVDVSATANVTARIGKGLEVDYGPARVRRGVTTLNSFEQDRPFSWYAFAGAEGRIVGRNLFLDGNTFEDSRSVDTNLLTGEFTLGAAADFGRFELSYTHVLRTREFSTQDKLGQFGSVQVRFAF